MTNPTDSAFPYQFENAVGVTSSETGLTKREFFAALALQGLMASVRWEEENGGGLFDYRAPSARVMAATAVQQADELIKALNGR